MVCIRVISLEGLPSVWTRRTVRHGMAVSSPGEKTAGKGAAASVDGETESPFRVIREQRGLTKADVARLTGMHRNSVSKLENGTTREVTAENAAALEKVLKTSLAKLGLRVRGSAPARSVRFRRLTAEQRQIIDELLSLPSEDYALIRGAIERLRVNRRKKASRGARP